MEDISIATHINIPLFVCLIWAQEVLVVIVVIVVIVDHLKYLAEILSTLIGISLVIFVKMGR